jgi:DNA-binding transcriptional LysR family regulator
MDLVQLRRFLVAAEAGNLRRAATLLHVSQPALTQSIKGTRAGSRRRAVRAQRARRHADGLRPRARAACADDAQRTRAHRRATWPRSSTAIRCASPSGSRRTSAARSFPPPCCARSSSARACKVQIVEGHTTELVKRMQEGDIELAFCVHNKVIDDDAALEFATTYEERYTVMTRGGPSAPAAQARHGEGPGRLHVDRPRLGCQTLGLSRATVRATRPARAAVVDQHAVAAADGVAAREVRPAWH